jgi:hypothetical protein
MLAAPRPAANPVSRRGARQDRMIFAPMGVIDLGQVGCGGSGSHYIAVDGQEYVGKCSAKQNGGWVCFKRRAARRDRRVRRVALQYGPLVVEHVGGTNGEGAYIRRWRREPYQSSHARPPTNLPTEMNPAHCVPSRLRVSQRPASHLPEQTLSNTVPMSGYDASLTCCSTCRSSRSRS